VSAGLTDPRWQSRSAVFHAVPLPRAAKLLSDIAAMHERESDTKRRLLDALSRMVAQLQLQGASGAVGGGQAASLAAALDGGTTSSNSSNSSGPELLRERLTVAIAAWLARPFIDDEKAGFLLDTLTDDMAGF